MPQGPQTEREASAFPAGSGGAIYWDFPFPPTPDSGYLAIARVKSGQVGRRKSSVSRAMVIAGQWSVVCAGGRAAV